MGKKGAMHEAPQGKSGDVPPKGKGGKKDWKTIDSGAIKQIPIGKK